MHVCTHTSVIQTLKGVSVHVYTHNIVGVHVAKSIFVSMFLQCNYIEQVNILVAMAVDSHCVHTCTCFANGGLSMFIVYSVTS